MKTWYVYIMTNKPEGVLYTGVTNDIETRVSEHKNKLFNKSFTARYNCDKLVYFEECSDGFEAVKREKRIKKWKRDWKIKLIQDVNPQWQDISINWNINQDLIYKTKRFLPAQE